MACENRPRLQATAKEGMAWTYHCEILSCLKPSGTERALGAANRSRPRAASNNPRTGPPRPARAALGPSPGPRLDTYPHAANHSLRRPSPLPVRQKDASITRRPVRSAASRTQASRSGAPRLQLQPPAVAKREFEGEPTKP